MKQRIFDATNDDDIAELFSLFPSFAYKIQKNDVDRDCVYSEKGLHIHNIHGIIKINWHDLTEIKRPVEYRKGQIGWFWDDDKTVVLGILVGVTRTGYFTMSYKQNLSPHGGYKHFRPLTKEEAIEMIG